MAQNGATQPSITHQAMYSVAGVGAHGIARFVYAIVVARLLGPESLAAFTTALAISLIVSLMWPTGLGIAAAHFTAINLSSRNQLNVLRLAIRSFVLVTAPFALIATSAAFLLGFGPLEAITTGILTFSYSGYVALRSILLSLHLARRVALFETLAALIALSGLGAVVGLRMNEWVLLPLGIAYLPFLIAGVLQINTLERTNLRFSEVRGFHVMAGWNSGSLLAANGLIQLSMIAVTAYAPAGNQAALYAAAVSVAGPAGMFAQALSQVLQPRVSSWRFQHEDSGRQEFRSLSFRILLGLTVVFGLGIMVAPTLTTLVLGADYAGAGPSLQILLVGMWAFSVANVLAVAPIAARTEHQVTIAYAVGAILGAATIALAWPIISASVAASVGVTVGYILAAILIARVSTKAYQVPSEVP